jgi:hypothetical protein
MVSSSNDPIIAGLINNDTINTIKENTVKIDPKK